MTHSWEARPVHEAPLRGLAGPHRQVGAGAGAPRAFGMPGPPPAAWAPSSRPVLAHPCGCCELSLLPFSLALLSPSCQPLSLEGALSCLHFSS